MASLLSGGVIPGGMSFQQLFSMMMQNMPNMKSLSLLSLPMYVFLKELS